MRGIKVQLIFFIVCMMVCVGVCSAADVVAWGNPSMYVLDVPDGLDAAQITVESIPPICNFTTVDGYCKLTFTGLINTPKSDPIREYHWEFGDGETSTLQNPMHTYNISQSLDEHHYYTVVFSARNSVGWGTVTRIVDVHNEPNYIIPNIPNFGVWLPFSDRYLGEFITLDEYSGIVTIDSMAMVATCINWLLEHTAQFGVLIASLAIVTIVTVKTQSVFALFFSLSLILSNMYAPWCPEEAKLLLWVILAIALIGIILKPIIRKI